MTGYVRANGTGDSTRVTDLSTRAISSDEIGPAIGRTVYGGFVELRSEDPSRTTELEPVELPELDNGPHFFYGLQWWFFGLLAIFGFFYLLYDEWRNGPRGERLGPAQKKPGPKSKAPAPGRGGEGADRAREGSEGAQHAAVDGQHRPGHERRRGREQEGRGPAELLRLAVAAHRRPAAVRARRARRPARCRPARAGAR